MAHTIINQKFRIMNKFTFYKDTQFKLFRRDKFIVEAETYEQAEKKAKSYAEETWDNALLRGENPVVSRDYVWDSLQDVDDIGAIRILDSDENIIVEK